MHTKKFFTSLIIFIFLSFNTCYCREKYVYPCGEAVGVKFYTNGLLVVGTEGVYSDGKKVSSPAEDAGVKKGDVLLKVNGKELLTNSDLADEAQNGEIELSVRRGADEFSVKVNPVKTSEGNRIGLWLRDSTAGIGTVTYADTENGSFAALGHGICDIDTGKLMPIRRGSIGRCSVSSVKKSSRGVVGELECSFEDEEYGNLMCNSQCGIYGKLTDVSKMELKDAKKIAAPHEGDAVILAEIDENGVSEYSAEILKVYNAREASKSIVIEITDNKLIEKTGGIIQGMSGAPIIQGDELVGAVTHVFVNDPHKGYGIKSENMAEFSNDLK